MNLKYMLIASIFAVACTSPSHAQEPTAKTSVTTYQVKGSYGTLVYEGKIERRETPMEYEYLIEQLKLRFNPKARTNEAKEIKVKVVLIVATSRPIEGDGKSTVLHHDTRSSTIVLNKRTPNGTLEKIKLVLPKETVDKADHVGFALPDGELLWPIHFSKSTTARAVLKNAS